MSTPLIGITGRRKKGSDVNGVLAVQGELDIDLYFTVTFIEYVKANQRESFLVSASRI